MTGLVGGFIVLQLLARGTLPRNIRILDVRGPERDDLKTGPAAEVEFITTDIRSAASVSAADRKSTRLNSSHSGESRMPSSA